MSAGSPVLAGITIVEVAAIGPAPFAAMMLADHGARVIRIERPGAPPDPRDPLLRGRAATIAIDLKTVDGAVALRALSREADGLIEGFRPGVMERLGLGPEALLGDNPDLVYGRMTGWGQDGPLAHTAGHDINYIAVSGVLGAIGPAGGKPTVPLNLAGDFGGGGMMLAFGMLAGIIAARAGRGGCVVDAAMTDGSALLTAMIWGLRERSLWTGARGDNILDGGAPFYDTYETADGRYIAIGAIEPEFYRNLLQVLGLIGDPMFADQFDRTRWAEQKATLTALFAAASRTEWCARFDGAEACFAPVLDFDEAAAHPHNIARATFVRAAGAIQPAAAPRFGRPG